MSKSPPNLNFQFQQAEPPKSTPTDYVLNQGWITIWGDIDEVRTENVSMFLLQRLFQGKKYANIIICSNGGEAYASTGLMAIMEFCKRV